MDTEGNKPKRYRRTKADIERSIDKAAKDIILRKGFSGVTVLDIIKRAKIEPITFYTRYRNLEEFFDSFVREYDYWFSEMTRISSEEKQVTSEGYNEIVRRLFDNLKDDSIMMELLRWEVNECNSVTRRTAMNRELHTLPLASAYEKLFDGTGVDFVAISSLLIAGIYYLSLHRKCSPFCGIDVSTEEGCARIQRALTQLSDILFRKKEADDQPSCDRMARIAERMRQKGLSEEDIAYCLAE